ncbi:hypothetical protein BJX70DRAFT_357063 [Aspergillus crustosus]
MVPLPYRPQFPNDDASMVPYVRCVDQLMFEWMWGGTVSQLAERCISLRYLKYDRAGSVRPDHLEYLRKLRQAISETVATLPKSLISFQWGDEEREPWATVLPGLDLLSDDTDTLTDNLRHLSMNLAYFDRNNTAVALDFLFPLDNDDHPAPQTLNLYWPFLREIDLTSFPNSLPSGEWLFGFHQDHWDVEWPEIASAILADPEILDSEMTDALFQRPRKVVHADKFHRLFISLGHAAQRMPVLEKMLFHTQGVDISFQYMATGFSERPALVWVSASGYQPDERVAGVWGFELGDMITEERESRTGKREHITKSDVTLRQGLEQRGSYTLYNSGNLELLHTDLCQTTSHSMHYDDVILNQCFKVFHCFSDGVWNQYAEIMTLPHGF